MSDPQTQAVELLAEFGLSVTHADSNPLVKAAALLIQEVGDIDLDDPEDAATELADRAVPIYTADILDMAAANPDLLALEPELGPANGSNWRRQVYAIRYVVANIYEALEYVAQQALQARTNN